MVAEKVFAVIAETTRRDILAALAQESKAVGQLVDELGVSQPTVSKHLRVLREAGVVTMRAQGQKRFYGINTEPLGQVVTWLESLGAGSGQAPIPSIVRTIPAGQQAKHGQLADSDRVEMMSAATNGTSAPAHVPAAAATALDSLSAAGTPSIGTPQIAGAPEGQRAFEVPQESATEESGMSVAGGTAPPQGEVQASTSSSLEVAPAAVRAHASTGLAVQAGDHDGTVQGQISRSVGRAANKAADLLANLPTLPAFRRKKD